MMPWHRYTLLGWTTCLWAVFSLTGATAMALTKMADKYLKTNQHAWNLRTSIHVDSEFYDVEGFCAGAVTLHPPELELAGNVEGMRLLHLQCHFGLDTLSWGRLGAVPTGVDFSPDALAVARELSERTAIRANFIEADVQNLGPAYFEYFDLAIVNYGVLCCL